MTSWQWLKKYTYRELLLQIRQPKLLLNAALFFLMIMVFFPLTLPASSALLQQTAPGLIWIALLLATMLASERLFQSDYDDGIIEQWLIFGAPLVLIVAGKIISHWLVTLGALLLFCPLLALLFNFSSYELQILALSLVLGTPAIVCLCALAAAFSSGMQQKGIFMALILLPLTVPVMIFGSGTLTVALQAMPVSGYLALLLAMSIVAGAFLPFAIAAIIRVSLAD